jgi:hypothetical protein
MTCSLCSKTAWYYVGKKKFFCGDHRKEAIEASKAEGSKATKGSAA